jgi:uncharacterized protein (TIGR00730 family)
MQDHFMSNIKSICVYCGSATGRDPAFIQAARELGQVMAANDIRLIYGGGALGLMGAVAESVVKHGGKVTGIIPKFLIEKELGYGGADELIVTDNMHQRKQLMFERADAFVALPGGIGTLEELVEQLTWAQLGRHKKPILLANIQNFWEPLLETISHMVEQGFVHSASNMNFVVCDKVSDIVPKLRAAAAGIPDVLAEPPEVVERM